MTSPLKRRTLFDDMSAAEDDIDLRSTAEQNMNGSPTIGASNKRKNRNNPWTGGTLRPDGNTQKLRQVSLTETIQEESMTLSLYIIGSDLLHMIFKCIMGIYTNPLSKAVSYPYNSLEYFLQVVWLYHAARPTFTNHRQALLSVRLTCWRLGRLQNREMLLIACIHAGLLLFYSILLSSLVGVDGVHESGASPFSAKVFLQSTLQMAGCVIVLFVVPVFLQINRLPPSLTIFLLRPPRLVASPVATTQLIISQVLAGLLAGKVMEHYFPDDPVI